MLLLLCLASLLWLEPSVQSVQFSRLVVSDSLWPHGLQHVRLPCPSPIPGACSNSCPLSWWCHLTISSNVIPFSSCLQSFPASESFPGSWLFTSHGQSIGVSASASVLPKNIQGWFPLGFPVRIDIIKKSTNNKCWRACGEEGTLLHCWWECKLIRPLWRTVWRYLKKLGIKPPYDPAIPLVGI